MRKRVFYLCLFLVIVAAVGVFALRVRAGLHQPLDIEEPLFLSVKSGDTLYGIANKLSEQEIIDSGGLLVWADRLYGPKPIFAADYLIEPGTTTLGLYEALTEGKSISPDKQVTIVEGLTLAQTADELVEAGIIADKDAFLAVAEGQAQTFKADYDVLQDLPAKATLEGYLFPNTYRFFPNSEPEVVIRKMVSTLDQRFDDDLIANVKASGRTLHQVITLASIVEREVQSDEDMGVVAGLFTNRLQIGMALQADSTVGYLTKSGRARSTFEDLEIDSPYNTYKYPGLPPGPISNPGWRAIAATINPTPTDYLFFLTDKQGNVYYASDLAGHNYNRRYLDGVK